MMGFTKNDAFLLAAIMRKKNKTITETKWVSAKLKSLSKVQKIWVNDELALLEQREKKDKKDGHE